METHDEGEEGMFAARVNCVTGKVEWVVTGKDMDSVDTDLSEEFSRLENYSVLINIID